MSFRDEGDAQRHRIESLEQELEAARRERDEALAARDRALAEAAETDAQRGARLASSTRFAKGARVFVEWNEKWWDATVVEVKGPAEWRIHYDGWGRSWDETVGPSRILPCEATPPGPRAGRTPRVTTALVMIALLGLAVVVGTGLVVVLSR